MGLGPWGCQFNFGRHAPKPSVQAGGFPFMGEGLGSMMSGFRVSGFWVEGFRV